MASEQPPARESRGPARPVGGAARLQPPAAVLSLGALAGLAGIVGLLLVVRAVWAGEPLDERRVEIQSLDTADQERLRRNYERFLGLDAAEQDRIRQLHQAIKSEPNADELLAVMERYSEWLKTLTPFVRAELKDLPPDKRIERIREITEEQKQRETERARYMNAPRAEAFKQAMKDPGSRLLTADDVEGLFRWIEEVAPKYKARFLESLPEDRRQQIGEELEKAQDPARERDFLGAMWLRWQADHPGELPPVTEEELASLRAKLSEETRKRLEGMSDDEQRSALTRWIRFLVMQEYALRRSGPRFPVASEEELAEFLESLDSGERSFLMSLPGDEMRRRLTWRYMQSKMPDVPFYHPEMGRRGWGSGFGPGRGGPSGAGRRPPGGFPPGGRDGERPGRDQEDGRPRFGPPPGGPNGGGPPPGRPDPGEPPPEEPSAEPSEEPLPESP